MAKIWYWRFKLEKYIFLKKKIKKIVKLNSKNNFLRKTKCAIECDFKHVAEKCSVEIKLINEKHLCKKYFRKTKTIFNNFHFNRLDDWTVGCLENLFFFSVTPIGPIFSIRGIAETIDSIFYAKKWNFHQIFYSFSKSSNLVQTLKISRISVLSPFKRLLSIPTIRNHFRVKNQNFVFVMVII